MNRRAAFLFFILINTFLVKAQFTMSENVKLAYTKIYSLHLNEAERLIRKEEKVLPNNAFIPYLKFNLAFAEVFISEKEQLYNSVEQDLDDWIDVLKETDETSPWRGFCLTEMYMLRSSLKLKFGLSVKAGFDALKAYNTAEEMNEDFPDFKPQWLCWGLINVAVGSVPDNYKFAASALGFEGDIQVGLDYLKASWSSTQSDEYAFFYEKSTLIYGYVLQQVAGQDSLTLEELGVDYKNNVLLIYLQAKLLNSQRRNSEVIELLEKRPQSEDIFPFYYLNYMEGRAKLAAFHPNANQPLEDYLRLYQGKHFIKAVHYYLSIYYFFEGNSEMESYHKSEVFNVGYDFTGADKMAVFMAARPYNKTLLKAQNYFDNGEYKKAKSELNLGVEYCKNRIDSLEMFYRRGRVFLALNDDYNSISSFKECIRLNGKQNIYYAANSALYLAKIFEGKKMNASANYYYKLALKFKDYPFVEGVQQQAKAGKKRVE